VAWIPARVVRWSVLSLRGFFSSAQRVPLMVAASSARFAAAELGSQTAADLVEGRGRPREDGEGIGAQHRTRGPRRDHCVDELGAIGADVGERGGALTHRDRRRTAPGVCFVRSFPVHTSRSVSWQVTTSRYRCPLRSGDLVDPDSARPRRPVYSTGPLGDHPAHDACRRPPRDPQPYRHHRRGGVADQPGRGCRRTRR